MTDNPMTADDAGGPSDTLRPSEALDSDEVRNRDGDEVVDPPEDWTAADKHGTSARVAPEGESLDDKLAAEEPDRSPDDHGRDQGQIDDTPEDGDSLFPVVD
jgi:hypothetical protein